MLENTGCKENLTETFPSHPRTVVSCRAALAVRFIAWAGKRCEHCSPTQAAGCGRDAMGPGPSQGLQWLFSMAHSRPGFAFRCACLPLGEAMGSAACGRVLPLNSGSPQAMQCLFLNAGCLFWQHGQ